MNVTYVSDDTKEIFLMVNLVIICTGLGCFGICTNIINIIVFVRQGFQDTITLTLFAMAISDLASLVTLLWQAICHNPLFRNADTSLLTMEVQDITGGWPHVLFVRITGWLTAFVTLERCLCVIFPLNVKSILTHTRVKVMIFTIYILVTAGMAPIFYSTRLDWKFVPNKNKTMIGLTFSENWTELLRVSALLSGVTSSLGFSFLVVASTAILVVSLHRKAKWRLQAAANLNKDQQVLTKDQKVIKMVVSIAIVFIFCQLPPSLVSIPLALVPEFSIVGQHGNLLMVIISFCMTLEAINASVNIFVYYYMSAKYKLTFQELVQNIRK